MSSFSLLCFVDNSMHWSIFDDFDVQRQSI
jgi:hypothetical protein